MELSQLKGTGLRNMRLALNKCKLSIGATNKAKYLLQITFLHLTLQRMKCERISKENLLPYPQYQKSVVRNGKMINLACPIGLLLPNNYDLKLLNDISYNGFPSSLKRKMIGTYWKELNELISDIQRIHDFYPPKDWTDQFNLLLEKYCLSEGRSKFQLMKIDKIPKTKRGLPFRTKRVVKDLRRIATEKNLSYI